MTILRAVSCFIPPIPISFYTPSRVPCICLSHHRHLTSPDYCPLMHLPSPSPHTRTPHHDLIIEARTLCWARTIVVGLNLCPYAVPVLNTHRVRTSVTHATTEAELFATFNDEANLLLKTNEGQLATTLLVAPRFAQLNFERFYRFERFLNTYLDKLGNDDFDGDIGKKVMVACFHPLYEYKGEVDAAVHYDKRAPYPIVNLLRSDMVDAVAEEGKTADILDRNRKTLENVGVERLKLLYETLDWDKAFGPDDEH